MVGGFRRAGYTALNYALASIEAICCKWWLAQVYDELRARFRYGWDGDVVIVVHDEVACCCRPEIAGEVGSILVRHAIAAGEHYGLKVPLAAEYTIGRDWAGTPIEAAESDTPADLTIPDFLNRTVALISPSASNIIIPAETPMTEIITEFLPLERARDVEAHDFEAAPGAVLSWSTPTIHEWISGASPIVVIAAALRADTIIVRPAGLNGGKPVMVETAGTVTTIMPDTLTESA